MHAGADGNGTGTHGWVHLAINSGCEADIKDGAGDGDRIDSEAVLTHSCALAVAIRGRGQGRVSAALS